MFTRFPWHVDFHACMGCRLGGNLVVGAAVILCVLGLGRNASAQSSASFSIVSAALNSGGGQSSATDFSLNGCLSPNPVAGGTSSSTSFRLQVGCLDLRTLVRCGNGQIDPGEVCDDGNTLNGDCCSSDCQIPGPVGAACGDTSTTECSDPDTCDGLGNCLVNDAVAGVPAIVQCDDATSCTFDECNGTGGCQHVNGPLGLLCGDGSDTECTHPDTCDGAGTCLANDEAAGTGAPATCDDTSECTIDECNGTGGCQHPPVAAGTTAATTCSDGSECTADECDGAGGCQNPPLSSGTPCGDTSSSTCDGADSCDGSGVCMPNRTPAGATCGDPNATDCSGPDLCDGLGGCDPSDSPNGALCDDALGCTTADSCSGGVCTGMPVACPDDGNPCTFDQCTEPDGTCVNSPEPAPTCVDAVGAVSILDKVVTDAGNSADKLSWKWKGGEVALVELGDPTAATNYDVCVFESSAGEFSLVTHATIPAGADWRLIGRPGNERGWQFKDRTCSPDGICRVKLKADRKLGDGKGKGRVSVRGKGPNLPLPGPVSNDPQNRYLSLDPEVVVQLSNSEGACWAVHWETGVDKVFKNEVKKETGRFKTKRVVVVR